ncbi:hypothetical protein CsatB_010447 [Cannabis sativa]
MVPAAGPSFIKQFRFENVWLREPLCYRIIKDSWEIRESNDIMHKIKFCGDKLADWGKEKWKLGREEVSVANYKQAKKNLAECYVQREGFWHQRSKQLWLQEGDNNSKYFHASATTRRRNNFVAKLKDHSGAWVDWESGLDDLMNVELLLPISDEEVRKSLFQMHPDKSLGPDGMTTDFFQKCWSIAKDDVINLVKQFFHNGSLPTDLNKTILVLIRKKIAYGYGGFTTIALCNVVYKIVSKVVANRLKSVMPSIISDTQSVFLQGRLISDNIMIAYEIMHHLKRKRRGRDDYMALKLDVSKAYDKLEWGYLRAMMELGPIVGQRVLRQGDPLSPYLFILCVEGFSSLLQSYEQSGLLTGCKIARGAPVISHMLFADDSYIYCKATEEEAYNVKELLHTYEVASGQRINFSKSFVFFSNKNGIEVRDSICAMFEIYEADENGYYLGLPCSVGRNKNAILGFLKDKLRKRIQGWEGHILSRTGKEVLLKSIAQVLPSYAMNVFLLPSDTCKELERLMAKFWWHSDSSSGKGINWMSWERLCRHKHARGLGFRSLRDFNLALLGNQYCCLLVNADSLVSRLYKAKYYATGNLFTGGLGDNPSFIWRSILEAKDLIHACAQRTIANGENSVSYLFQVGTRAWDEDVVRDIFVGQSKGAWCREANTDFWKRLWSLKIPSKISNFLWRAASGVLPTCFQLQKRYVPVNADNPLCNSSTETIPHELVECSVAKAAWHRSIVDVGAGAVTFSSWLLGIFTRGHEVEMEEAAMVSWAIWRVRNDFVWQKKSWLASNIVTSARILLD